MHGALGALFAIGLIVIFSAFFWYASIPARGYFHAITTQFVDIPSVVHEPNVERLQSLLLAFGVSLVVVTVLFIRWRRDPVRFAARLPKSSIIAASGFILVFCGCVAATAWFEHSASEILEHRINGELKFAAAMSGRTLPPYAAPPPMP